MAVVVASRTKNGSNVRKIRRRVLRYVAVHDVYNKYKWKNHFVEMKGDVGMSVHEKGGNK